MAVKKFWHISIFSTEAVKPINISLSKKLGFGLFGFAAFLFLLLSSSIIYIIHNQDQVITAQKILSENEKLKNKLQVLTTQVDSMMAKLKLMEEWEDKIRSDENFRSIDSEIRKMGIGGLPHIDTTFADLNEKLHLNYNVALNKIIQLNSKIDFNYHTHEELLEQVKLKKSLYENTPSIYPTYGRISDGYGWRRHPITSKRSFHHGIDLANRKGTPIYATADGVIKETGRKRYFGNYIAISHKFGYQTNYAHLNRIFVREGDTVKRGQIIAEMGNSGRSTGAHLHYEVLRYNKFRNPYKYLNRLEDDIILTKK